jgi:hypothetical protein
MKRSTESTSDAAVEPYHFEKDKLPKKFSYPLKRSHLDTALRASSVYGMVFAVSYVGRRNSNLLLDAFFTPEQHHAAVSAGRVFMRVWAVPSADRHRTEQLFLEDGLSRLCRWLQKAQTEGNVWRGTQHRLIIEIAGEELRAVEE